MEHLTGMTHKFTLRFSAAFAAIALIGCLVHAVPLNNGPYPPEDLPPTVKLEPLEFVKLSDSDGFFQYGSDVDTRIHISMDSGVVFAEIHCNDRVEFPQTRLFDSGLIYPGQAWAAKLNDDGREDFLLSYPTGGCGLNADLSYICILLSTDSGYKLTVTATWFDPSDLIVVDERPRLIHSSFIGLVSGCSDGQTHSFWVYNLLGFQGGAVHIDNSGETIFPKVVWYSEKPNYRETERLTAEQKAVLIKNNSIQIEK